MTASPYPSPPPSLPASPPASPHSHRCCDGISTGRLHDAADEGLDGAHQPGRRRREHWLGGQRALGSSSSSSLLRLPLAPRQALSARLPGGFGFQQQLHLCGERRSSIRMLEPSAMTQIRRQYTFPPRTHTPAASARPSDDGPTYPIVGQDTYRSIDLPSALDLRSTPTCRTRPSRGMRRICQDPCRSTPLRSQICTHLQDKTLQRHAQDLSRSMHLPPLDLRSTPTCRTRPSRGMRRICQYPCRYTPP